MNKIESGLLAATIGVLAACNTGNSSPSQAEDTCDKVHGAIMALYISGGPGADLELARKEADKSKLKCEQASIAEQKKMLDTAVLAGMSNTLRTEGLTKVP